MIPLKIHVWLSYYQLNEGQQEKKEKERENQLFFKRKKDYFNLLWKQQEMKSKWSLTF